MFRCWMAVTLVAVLWAGRVEAKELTGFGPIKFGMTKEEALAALENAGLEGEWEEDHLLVYQYPIHDTTALSFSKPGATFEVTQIFWEGRAVDVHLYKEWSLLNRSICLMETMYFVSAVKNLYDKKPIILSGADYKRIFGKKFLDSSIITRFYDSFWFDFEKEALIRVAIDTNHTGSNCQLFIWYHPPQQEVIPF